MRNYFQGCLTVLLCLFSTSLFAQQTLDTQLQAAINHYLAKEGKKEGVTGIAATVSYPVNNAQVKKTVVTGVVGFAPYNTQPVTKDKLFEIGSITKSFTAVLILQLEAEGLLSLDDKIGRWLPQYPNWKNVTIRQLLNMTSGIPSYSRNADFQQALYSDIRKEFTNAQLLQYADPGKSISKKVHFDYSNTNYILAGLIIEAVTKHSFAEELQKRLLDTPYKLNNTFYVAGPDWKAIRAKIMPRMVHGYYKDDVTKKMVDVTDSNLNWAGPAGGMIADTQDMADWVQVLYHGLAIPPAYRQQALGQLETLVSMKTGKPLLIVSKADPKGFGLGVGSFYGEENGDFWIYEGSGMGYRMMYIWQSCNNVSVVVALNNKAGEGGGGGGDHIQTLVMDLYNQVLIVHPQYRCNESKG